MSDPILLAVKSAIPGMTPDATLLWDALAVVAPDSTSTKPIIARLGVPYSSLVTRMRRYGLPSLYDLMAGYRICLVAWLFDQPGYRVVSEVAYRLNYASPQTFGRHLRTRRGITPAEFRERCPFNAELQRYLAVLAPTARLWSSFTLPQKAGIPVRRRLIERRCPTCHAPHIASAA